MLSEQIIGAGRYGPVIYNPCYKLNIPNNKSTKQILLKIYMLCIRDRSKTKWFRKVKDKM